MFTTLKNNRYRASQSNEDATVRLTAGVIITPELAEPVKDSWVTSLLNEDVRNNVVQVSNTPVLQLTFIQPLALSYPL